MHPRCTNTHAPHPRGVKAPPSAKVADRRVIAGACCSVGKMKDTTRTSRAFVVIRQTAYVFAWDGKNELESFANSLHTIFATHEATNPIGKSWEVLPSCSRRKPGTLTRRLQTLQNGNIYTHSSDTHSCRSHPSPLPRLDRASTNRLGRLRLCLNLPTRPPHLPSAVLVRGTVRLLVLRRRPLPPLRPYL